MPQSSSTAVASTTCDQVLLPTNWECANLNAFTFEHDTKPDLNVLVDPDIAGVGVLIAFLLSAYLTLLIAVVSYVLGLVPEGQLNIADREFFRANARMALGSRRAKKVTTEALLRGIRAFSDQQIITGIAILVAGWSKLLGDKKGNLSAYHFHTIIYLAWMSSNVHLSTLTLLRDPLRGSTFVRWWRLVGMGVLFLGLFIALLPTVFVPFNDAVFYSQTKGAGYSPFETFNGLQWPGAKAACFWLWNRPFWADYWDGRPHPHANYGAIFSYVLLIVSYGYYVVGLFPKLFKKLGRILRWHGQTRLENILRKMLEDQPNVTDWNIFRYEGHLLLVLFYALFVVIADLLISFAGALWALGIGLIWGTLNVLVPWTYINLQTFPAYGEQLSTEIEAHWGFGQIMAVTFLALPILAFLEPFLDDDMKKRIQKSKGPKTRADYNAVQNHDGTFLDDDSTEEETSIRSDAGSFDRARGHPFTSTLFHPFTSIVDSCYKVVLPGPNIPNTFASSLISRETIRRLSKDEPPELIEYTLSAPHVFLYTSKLFKGLFVIGQLFLAGETAILCVSQATVMTGKSRFTLDANEDQPWSPWTVSITTGGATLGLILVYLFVGLHFSKLGHGYVAHVLRKFVARFRRGSSMAARRSTKISIIDSQGRILPYETAA
ncbi:MAG: hypothetical protein M1820_006492 [Bogoriella megaspora]|nr:MAG: hypothetical protein M1820_006492 [Bogoriella megaspora]